MNTKHSNEKKLSNSKSRNKISINYESPNQKTKRSNSNYSKSLSKTISRSKSKSATRSIVKSTKKAYEGLNKKNIGKKTKSKKM